MAQSKAVHPRRKFIYYSSIEHVLEKNFFEFDEKIVLMMMPMMATIKMKMKMKMLVIMMLAMMMMITADILVARLCKYMPTGSAEQLMIPSP